MNGGRRSLFSRRSIGWIAGVALLFFVVGAIRRGLRAASKPEALSVNSGVEAKGRRLRVIDLAGRSVDMAGPAERIVLVRGREIHSLALLLGDSVEDKLIAWGPDIESADQESYRAFVERYPKLARIPKIGSIYSDSIDVEFLLTLQPDLVVVDNFMVRRGYRSIERMKNAGLPLIFTEFGMDPLSGPQDSIKMLGAAVGKGDVADEVVSFIQDQLSKVDDQIAKEQPPRDGPTVYMECGNRGVSQFGHTYGYDERKQLITWGKYLNALRCRNIALGRVPDRTPIHPEYVLSSEPSMIVMTGSTWTNSDDCMLLGLNIDSQQAADRLHAFSTRPGWKELSAVKDRRLHAIYHNFCILPTSFVAYQQLAKWAYPNRFSDLNPEANMRTFHERFSRLDYKGTWVVDGSGATSP